MSEVLEYKEINNNRIKLFLKNNKKKIIFLVITFFILIILATFKNIRNINNNKLFSEKYIKANINYSSGDKLSASKMFDQIITSKNKFYSILALNSVLEKNLVTDKNKILYYFETLETIKHTKNTRELIKFKKALYLLKIGEKEPAKNLLNDLIEENSILKETASEILSK